MRFSLVVHKLLRFEHEFSLLFFSFQTLAAEEVEIRKNFRNPVERISHGLSRVTGNGDNFIEKQ